MFHGSLWFRHRQTHGSNPRPREGRDLHGGKLDLMRILFCLSLFPVLAFGSGCTHHSIREGIWELSFKARIMLSNNALPIPSKKVKVIVGWDEEGGEGEIAEITVLPEGASQPAVHSEEGEQEGDELSFPHRMDLKPMYAEIKVKHEGYPPNVHIEHSDGGWTWTMSGSVKSPTLIAGTNFYARHKLTDRVTSNGQWSLRWLRDR